MSLIEPLRADRPSFVAGYLSCSSTYNLRLFPLLIHTQCSLNSHVHRLCGYPSNSTLSIEFNSRVTRLHGVCFLFWMCGCPEMESYEEFCLRTLAILQEEGKFKKTTCEPLCTLKALSVICFHGRAVLSPLVRRKQTDTRTYPNRTQTRRS